MLRVKQEKKENKTAKGRTIKMPAVTIANRKRKPRAVSS